ncbi:MAG TPA: hypothetical protein VMS74_04750 [Acidimicrobiia bacterium]|nr:hypothetical protein [Acidimicrobiia bacterium]
MTTHPVRRLIVVAPHARYTLRVAEELAARFDSRVVVSPGIDGIPALEPAVEDVLIHGVPDVFGRLLAAPPGWRTIVVRHRIVAHMPVAAPVIDVGSSPQHDPALMAGALRALFKPICQQRGVRPIFEPPPPFGLAFVAPDGLVIPGSFGRTERPDVAGLADLVVVRPHGEPPPATRPLRDPAMIGLHVSQRTRATTGEDT